MGRFKNRSKPLHALIAALFAVLLACTPAIAMADMNGIDVSGYQSGDITAAAPADFVVIKATQGLGWSNINYSAQVANADRTGKATGMYHFANGGNAVAEADTFVNAVSDRVGKSVLALDWEQCLAYGRYGCSVTNPNWGNPAWIQTWVTRVHDRTAVWPIVYIQRSAVWQVNAWVRARCMLWVAQYASNAATGYQSNPWNAGASGEGMTQYTSSGYVGGRGPLDLNLFFGNRQAWQKIACGERAGCAVGTVTTAPSTHTETTTTTTDLNALASAVIRGEYGNGQDRRARLGGNYDRVMAIVNQRLGGAATVAPQQTTQANTTRVTVRSGDTMSGIASRTGLWPLSRWSVPSGNLNLIYPGQVVTYNGGGSNATGSNAPPATRTVTVRAGDTLSGIAARLGISYTQLTGYRSGNPNVIYPGEVLHY